MCIKPFLAMVKFCILAQVFKCVLDEYVAPLGREGAGGERKEKVGERRWVRWRRERKERELMWYN